MTRRPRPNESYDLPPGYQSAYQRIKSMEADGLVKILKYKNDRWVPALVMLDTQRPPAFQNWDHEIARGDVYVAFQKTNLLTHWDSSWDISEYHNFAKNHRINYDMRMELEGSDMVYFWEVDMGSETRHELINKIEKYAGLQDSMPQNPFAVLIAIETSNEAMQKKLQRVVGWCKEHGRGHRFLVGSLESLTARPLGDLFVDSRNVEAVSVLNVH
jgi:hypothetical protein